MPGLFGAAQLADYSAVFARSLQRSVRRTTFRPWIHTMSGELSYLTIFARQAYVGPPYFRAEIYAGCVACCPLVSHGEYADGRQTDRRTPDCYTTLYAMDAAASVICYRPMAGESQTKPTDLGCKSACRLLPFALTIAIYYYYCYYCRYY